MGYTKNVVTKCYEDVRLELKELLKNEANHGQEKHIELSDRLATLSDLIYNAECDARDERIDRRCE